MIDYLLPPLEAEVHVDIRHGHALRIEEPLEQQVIFDRINIRDFQAVGDDAARRRPSSGTHSYVIFSAIIDIIPHNQEIVHESHIPDNAEFIFHPFPQRPVVLRIPPRHAVLAQLI